MVGRRVCVLGIVSGMAALGLYTPQRPWGKECLLFHVRLISVAWEEFPCESHSYRVFCFVLLHGCLDLPRDLGAVGMVRCGGIRRAV